MATGQTDSISSDASASNSTWIENSQKIIHQFQELTDHVQKQLFQENRGRYYAPVMNRWGKFHRCIYWYSNPFAWFLESKKLVASFYLFFAFVAVLLQFCGGAILLSIGLGDQLIPASSQNYPCWDYFFSFIVLFVAIILIPAAYIRFREFIIDDRYSIKLRIFLTILIITGIVLFVLWVGSFPHPLSFLDAIQSKNHLIPILLTFVLFLFPGGIYGVLLASDLLISSTDHLRIMFKNLNTLHSPFILDTIQKIVSEPIETSSSHWSLSDLSKEELSTIQKWADANQETSTKRVTPALVLSAVAAILVGMDWFKALIQPVIENFAHFFQFLKSNGIGVTISPLEYLLNIFIFSFVIVLILYLVRLFTNIFRNIVIQGVILEASIVAGYAAGVREEAEKAAQERQKKTCNPWWKQLWGK